jgi:hypothetical protein
MQITQQVISGRALRIRISWARVALYLLTSIGYAALVFPFIRDPDSRYKSESLSGNYNQERFHRVVMDHQRKVLETI